MAQIARMQFETEIKSSSEKFYEVFCSKGYLLPKICPTVIQDLQVVKGDWASVGSIKQWTFGAAGKSETAKETVISMDKKNKSITMKTVEGEVLKLYKNIGATLQVTAKGSTTTQGSSVKWVLEYEKANKDSPPPSKYLDFLQIATKSVDAYLLRA